VTGGGVLLAAGYGRRFGSDKRRHALPDGSTLLVSSLRLYGSALARLIVVLRPGDEALAAVIEAEPLAAPARVIYCADAHLGMGHSLAAGARAAGGWRYLFVALADMPWVSPTTLGRLVGAIESAGDDAVVQPVHQGTAGHPVGFGSAHFPRLAALTGDEGARAVLRRAGSGLRRVDVDDPGVLRDLDTRPT